MWNEEELMEQLDNYFKTVTKEQFISDLAETGTLEFMEQVSNPELKLPEKDFEYNISGQVIAQEIEIIKNFETVNNGFRVNNVAYNLGSNLSYRLYSNKEIKEESIKQEIIDLPIGA